MKLPLNTIQGSVESIKKRTLYTNNQNTDK
jgi:hypothetical protein